MEELENEYYWVTWWEIYRETTKNIHFGKEKIPTKKKKDSNKREKKTMVYFNE